MDSKTSHNLRSSTLSYTVQAGNGPSFKKVQFFKNAKAIFVKISSILQCQKIPRGIRIRLENHLFPNWKQQKIILLNRKPLKLQLRKKFRIFSQKMYPISRIVPNTLKRGPFGFFNIHFVANCQKTEGGPLET